MIYVGLFTNQCQARSWIILKFKQNWRREFWGLLIRSPVVPRQTPQYGVEGGGGQSSPENHGFYQICRHKNSFSEPNVNGHFVVSSRFYLMQVHVSVHHDILIFNPIYIYPDEDLGISILTLFHSLSFTGYSVYYVRKVWKIP